MHQRNLANKVTVGLSKCVLTSCGNNFDKEITRIEIVANNFFLKCKIVHVRCLWRTPKYTLVVESGALPIDKCPRNGKRYHFLTIVGAQMEKKDHVGRICKNKYICRKKENIHIYQSSQ